MKRSVQIVVWSIAGILFIFIAYVTSLPDGLVHTVFCNVGQGDAIYMKFPDGKDMLIDGGPNEKVLTCIGSHMAFWDRTIELMVLTHPHQDHFNGLREVLNRYTVKHIILPPIDNHESESFHEFIRQVKQEGAIIQNLYAGDSIELPIQTHTSVTQHKIVFRSLWPDKKWVANNASTVLNMPSLAVSTAYNDLNDFSQVLLFTYGDFDILLTGDAEADILNNMSDRGMLSKQVEVLKVPHQGNKRALTDELTALIKPRLAVIMVGKNSYGHPDQGTIELLKKHGSLVKRTDTDGEVEVVSDGKGFHIE
jgi:competence protein ComEC